MYLSLQNPASCNTSSRVNCLICPDCGFGSHMHVIGMCLMIGYATNRTVTVYPQINLRVEPLSTTCTVAEGVNRTKWGKGEYSLSQTIHRQDTSNHSQEHSKFCSPDFYNTHTHTHTHTHTTTYRLDHMFWPVRSCVAFEVTRSC